MAFDGQDHTITERWKICIYGGFGEGVLYDLENDPLDVHQPVAYSARPLAPPTR